MGTGENRGAGSVTPELDVFCDEGGREAREQLLGGGGVDEELLGGVSHAGALNLGVDQDFFRELRIGVAVDVDEAHAGVMLDDGNGGVLRDVTDEAFAAAGNDAVDQRVELEERV